MLNLLYASLDCLSFSCQNFLLPFFDFVFCLFLPCVISLLNRSEIGSRRFKKGDLRFSNSLLMNNRREHRGSRSSLFNSFDAIEEGGIRASSSYSSDISEHDNDKAIDTLKDRVTFLKQLTGDVHDEVLSHNRLLDKTGNDMDASRGILSGTVNRFKMVFDSRSGRRTCKLVGYFVLLFLVLYFLYRVLRHV